MDGILTREYLHSIFEYSNGHLYWKVKTSQFSSICVGSRVGSENKKSGYMQAGINKKTYQLHRIIFFMHHGYLPEIIDHIDGNGLNNKIENLREATTSQNAWNAKIHPKTTSKFKNVVFVKDRKKWTCRLMVRGKVIHRGSFDSPEQANEFAISLRKELHGEFANNG